MQVQKKAFLMEQASSIIQTMTTPKYKHPRCPTIAIVIGATSIEHALLDLGACQPITLLCVPTTGFGIVKTN